MKPNSNVQPKPTILCVDDEIDNVDSLERLFRGSYTVLKAVSGAEALQILDQNPEPISVIITDQRMPGMTGVQFLEASLKSHPEAVRILLTGYTDIQSIIEAVNSGQIYRYLNKPWDPVDLAATVRGAVERFNLSRELQKKNVELSHALKELQSLDAAKNQFMILINHELKTPLTSIISFTDLIKETGLSEEQDICVKRIEKSSQRLRNLIDDVLLVLQGETGTLKAQIAPFTATDMQLNLGTDVQNVANQKGLRTVIRWPEQQIIGDRALLQQVLTRLLQNAIKFAVQNSQVLIRAEKTQPHRVRFAVFNQGPAIPGNVVDKIIKPFYLDENVMNHSSGMGLGLTICQSILKAHSTTLQVHNENDGVEVAFEVPCL